MENITNAINEAICSLCNTITWESNADENLRRTEAIYNLIASLSDVKKWA